MAGYPCCCTPPQTCNGWCPSGAPEQLQLTVHADTWDAGSETYPCDETQCNERTGVRLLNLLSPAEAAAEWWIGGGSYVDGDCMWVSDPFTACFRYDDLSEPPGSLPPVLTEAEFRYQAQYHDGLMQLYLLNLDNESALHVAWEADVAAIDCGDPITLDYLSAGTELGAAFCVFDDTQQPTLELPP